MTRTVFDDTTNATLNILDETVTLREIMFQKQEDTVAITFNGFHGRKRTEAAGIPMEDFIMLCQRFLEDQGMVLRDPPDCVQYFIEGNDEPFDKLETAQICANAGDRIFREELYWTNEVNPKGGEND